MSPAPRHERNRSWRDTGAAWIARAINGPDDLSPALAQRRRVYLRRRAGALGGLLVLLIVVIAALASGGRHRAQARVETPPAVTPAPITRLAARQQRAVSRVLSYTSYIARGSSRKREVALTFDDGPGPFTPQVLAVLKRHRVPATFFVVGRSLHDFGVTLPKELADGFVVGDHTEQHPLLTRLTLADQQREIAGQAVDIQSYEAPYPRLFRPPYGGFNADTLDLLQRNGMLMVLWSVDTHDYLQPGVQTIVQRALGGAKPGAVILMHDAGGPRAQTVAALPFIIAGLHRRHLRPVTMLRLLLDDPPNRNQPPPRSLAGGAG
jgi:peptidoglycan/xylan/chitin deacetylase (PgdA/CDA1 family)